MRCPECRLENPEGVRSCIDCGSALAVVCTDCGRANLPGSNFCNECGQDLGKLRVAASIDYSLPRSYTPKFLADKILNNRSSIEGERKVLTVLFADVADYTAMAEKLDPEEAHQILNGYFKILTEEIHRYEGTINQFTGDGVMALFGAPVAHEDHAQRACYAALSIQKAVGEYGEKIKKDYGQTLKMRIGLNSGQVFVGSIGDDLRMDYTAIGDTTNLAFRMERTARPGTVRASENTFKLARYFFEFESLGKVPVRGKKEPQEAYELIRVSHVQTRIEAAAARGLTRFVGRRQEMEALKEASRKARSGSGQVVGIGGDAGVGKSRLLLEFRNMLPKNEYTFLAGRCLHYGGSMVYLPILDVLKSYFDIQEGDQEYDSNQKMREGLGRLDEKLLGALAPLQDVLSLKVEDEAYLQIDPQQRRQRIFEATRDLLLRLSEEKPLVLAIEDLHWIDTTSQDFLDFFAGALTEAPILLILLYRPEYKHAEASRSYLSEIALDQISMKTGAELVHSILGGGEVAPELIDLVLAKAGGNPLFVEELTHSLLENGSIRRKDDQHVLSREVSEIAVPDTIQAIISARMDRLEENLRRIMQEASAIGREFAYRILQAVTGISEELKTSLLNLQGLEFIYEKQLFPELEYIFKHDLTMEVAYNSLLLKRRSEIHEKIGRAIEEHYSERLEEYYELLAYHYERSDNTPKAVEFLDLANQKAAKANALEDAKGYFDKAMELLDTLPDTKENQEKRISLLANQGNVFFLLLKVTEYHDLLTRYEPVAASLANPGLRGAFYARLGLYEVTLGYFDQAIHTLTKASELCEASGYAEATGIAYYCLALSHFLRGEYDRVLELKEDLLRTMEKSFHLRSYVRGLSLAAQACGKLGRWDEAVELGNRALIAAQDYSDDSSFAVAEYSLSLVYVLKRDLKRAVEHAELSVARSSTPFDKVTGQAFLAWALCHAGEPQRGIELLDGILPIFRNVRLVFMELWCTLFLADAYWLAGNYDKARQTAEELLKTAVGCGARFYIGYAHRLLGEIALQANPSQAASHFDKSIAVFREIKTDNLVALTYSGMGRFHKQQGNTEQAREYLTNALEIFGRLGTLIEPDKVRKELAELPQ